MASGTTKYGSLLKHPLWQSLLSSLNQLPNFCSSQARAADSSLGNCTLFRSQTQSLYLVIRKIRLNVLRNAMHRDQSFGPGATS